jgi:hypothetical protein
MPGCPPPIDYRATSTPDPGTLTTFPDFHGRIFLSTNPIHHVLMQIKAQCITVKFCGQLQRLRSIAST